MIADGLTKLDSPLTNLADACMQASGAMSDRSVKTGDALYCATNNARMHCIRWPSAPSYRWEPEPGTGLSPPYLAASHTILLSLRLVLKSVALSLTLPFCALALADHRCKFLTAVPFHPAVVTAIVFEFIYYPTFHFCASHRTCLSACSVVLSGVAVDERG